MLSEYSASFHHVRVEHLVNLKFDHYYDLVTRRDFFLGFKSKKSGKYIPHTPLGAAAASAASLTFINQTTLQNILLARLQNVT